MSFASVRFAPFRFAPEAFAALRLISVIFAPMNLEPTRLANIRFAPDRFAPERFVRFILAFAKSRFDKSASDRSHLLQALVSFNCLRCSESKADAPVLTREADRINVAYILIDTLLIVSPPIIPSCCCLGRAKN